MKAVDDTPLPKGESERIDEALAAFWQALDGMNERLEAIGVRIANLESRRMLQADPNDDEEWF